MIRQFLCETTDGEGRVLTTGSIPVHDNWDQMQSYLGTALGREYALFFAEPYRGGGKTAWLHPLAGVAVPINALSPEAQQTARDKVAHMQAAITELSQTMRNGKSASEKHWAGLLGSALEFPSRSNLGENIYVAGDQPILVRWGMRDETSLSLAEMLKRPMAAPAPITPPVTQSVVVTPEVPVAPTRRGWAFWLMPLVWLAALLLFLAFLALWFRPCFLPLSWLWGAGNCGYSSAATVSANERHAELLQRLRVAQDKVADVDNCAVPEPEPAPPAPNTSTQETRLDRAREDAEGQLGDITVTLAWRGRSDLDLIFQCPDGRLAAKGNERNGGVCGGTIDVDANFCAQRLGGVEGGVCQTYRVTPTDTPVENGFFMRSQADKGKTLVVVRNYAGDAAAPGRDVPFDLQVRIGDQRQTFSGTVAPGQMLPVTDFRIE